MKRGLVTYLLIAAAFLCGAQEKPRLKSDILMDIGEVVMSGTMKLHVSHAISTHWTVEGGAGVCLAGWAGSATEDEKAHESGLGVEESGQGTGDEDRLSTLFYAAYWSKEAYKGPYIYAGCSAGDRTGPDMIIGAGYCIKIWNSLTIRIFGRLDIAATKRSGKAEGELLTLGIGYVF